MSCVLGGLLEIYSFECNLSICQLNDVYHCGTRDVLSGRCDHVVKERHAKVGNKERGSGGRLLGRRAERWEGGDGEMGDGGI